MKKLVLIDGNSLLNRAYYATKSLTTREGIPTNAVFGFTKLLLKIISDLHPDRLIVAFDLKAPTFRHKMYDEYKATRKPMPDDLAVQVGMLKELLHSMNIAMCEKEGFEADDLVGTLSHKFSDVKSIIITGDKDSYQLIDEYTDVYLTKTGVSDLLKLTSENFVRQIGYEPCRVIDMKALMGDSSDNIPGVPGIGEKTAFLLVSKYGDLDTIYEHLEEIGGSVRTKLENGKDSAYLSKKLATIDRNVPLDIELDECAVRMPFSQEVRAQFLQLEFTSLLKMDIFEDPTEKALPLISQKTAELSVVQNKEEFCAAVKDEKIFSCVCRGDIYYLYFREKEYVLKPRITLLDEGLDPSEIHSILKGLFGNKDLTVIAYGIKELKHTLASAEIEVNCKFEDVSILKYLVDYTGKEDNLQYALQSYGFSDQTPAYGINMLYKLLADKLHAEKLDSLYYDVELPLADVLFDMEQCGVKVDTSASALFETRYREEISRATAAVYEAAGETFNINSPAQLGRILFEKLGLPVIKKTKTGYSTSVEVLDQLKTQSPIVSEILDYRQIAKIQSTYVKGLLDVIQPDGRVHTRYLQTLTATGRLSSVDPNLQNIPTRTEEGKQIRKAFVPSEPDGYIFSCDYSQVELRVLAHVSGDQNMQEAFKTGYDIHSHTAMKIFHLDSPDQVTPLMRRHAKAVNFGIVYGISDYGLSKNLGISRKRAQEFIDNYFEQYPQIKDYMNKAVQEARDKGYAETIMHRRRYLPDIHAKKYTVRAFAERTAINSPIQGSAADIIKIAMINMQKKLDELHLKTKMVVQVHDELIFDVPKDELETIKKIVPEVMQSAVKLDVPLIADSGWGNNWYDAK